MSLSKHREDWRDERLLPTRLLLKAMIPNLTFWSFDVMWMNHIFFFFYWKGWNLKKMKMPCVKTSTKLVWVISKNKQVFELFFLIIKVSLNLLN